MKNILLIIIIFLLIIPFTHAEKKVKFFITSSFSGKQDERGQTNAELICASLEGEIEKQINEYLPCATYSTTANIGAALGWERERILLTSEDISNVESIGSALGAQYLICLKVTEMGSNVFLSAKCIDEKKGNPMAFVTDQGPNGEGAFDITPKLASKFVEDICKYEICPYKGKIKVHVVSEVKIDDEKNYPMYCNNRDATYSGKYKYNKNEDNYWQFNKISKVGAEGSLDYKISEETDREIDDPCYKCPKLVTRRYYHETYSKKGDISNLSEESKVDGVPVDDVRIDIVFNDDGTYMIKVKATSKQGELTETTSKYAECYCDAINTPPETHKNIVDIPLKEIFGPFKGTAKDKNLHEKPDPIVKTDPVTGEKTTIEIEFDLERE